MVTRGEIQVSFVVCPTINRQALRRVVVYGNTMPVPVPKVQTCAQFNAGVEGRDSGRREVGSVAADIAELGEVESCRRGRDSVFSVQE